MSKYLWVGIGGFAGSIARYALGVWIYDRMGTRFPYGTFVINITGCFLIGVILTVLDARVGVPPAVETRHPHRLHRRIYYLLNV